MRGKETRVLFLIKLIHTVIWVILSSAVFYVVWSGFSGRLTPYSWIAAFAIAIEGIVLLAFHNKCPLTGIARQYSDSPKDNFDIFLPNWLARYNKLIFTLLFVVGLILMIYQYVRNG